MEKLEKWVASWGVMNLGASPGNAKVERVSQEKSQGMLKVEVANETK